ncbi:hypothetical protein J6590_096709 [Homalodisca vitripennis]|nr:hypothetical protein J6590_096709 [Homalodisca vitripennis]
MSAYCEGVANCFRLQTQYTARQSRPGFALYPLLTGWVSDVYFPTHHWPDKTLSVFVGEVKAKRPSLTLNLGTNGLKVTSEPPPTAVQAGCLQGQNRSEVTYLNSSHARRCLIRLSCDNHCTRYTAKLTEIHPLSLIQSHRPILYATKSSTRRGPKQMVLKHPPKPLPTTNIGTVDDLLYTAQPRRRATAATAVEVFTSVATARNDADVTARGRRSEAARASVATLGFRNAGIRYWQHQRVLLTRGVSCVRSSGGSTPPCRGTTATTRFVFRCRQVQAYGVREATVKQVFVYDCYKRVLSCVVLNANVLKSDLNSAKVILLDV